MLRVLPHGFGKTHLQLATSVLDDQELSRFDRTAIKGLRQLDFSSSSTS